MRELADTLLRAFAASDLETLEPLCSENIVLYGTDADEIWHDRQSLFAALEALRAAHLQASWEGELSYGANWASGIAIYTLPDGLKVPTRVSLVFEEGVLVHAHFSVAVAEKLVPVE